MALDEQQKKLVEELLFSGVKRPSFAKKLYFGVFDSHAIFPYPEVSSTEKHQADELLTELNRFADLYIDPKQIDQKANIPESVLKGLGRLGVLGVTIPTQFGGLGMTQSSYCRVVEALSRRCGSTALFVNVQQSIGVKALLLFGTKDQQARWLKPLASGEQIAAFSLTEPNAGSDASGIETRAVYDPQRNIYRITGKKQWTTNGSIAQVLTVMALTEIDTPQGKQDKVTAFLVTPDMPGFKVTAPGLDKVGMKGTRTTNLEFTNMEVPAENILGPKGSGLRVCLTVLDYGRTTFGAMCLGAAKMCLERAISHAKSRYQFKRPIGSFALVKQKITQMSALTYAMDAATYLTAGLVDDGEEDFMLEAAMLKVFASDALWSIIYDTMQIFGGRSFFTDEPFERMMRDARLNMIGEGSNEVLRAFIGVVGMRDVGMELKDVVEALKSPLAKFENLRRFASQSIRRWGASKVPVQSPLLQQEAKILRKSVRRFGRAIVQLLGKYREDIFEKQLSLDRIATSAMAIYTASAVLAKLDRDLVRVNHVPTSLGNDVAVAKHYFRNAMATIDTQLGTLFDNRDAIIEAISDQITEIPPVI